METINITVKLPLEKIVEFRRFLDEHIEVVGFKVLPNTKKMWDADEYFRKINKNKKKASDIVEVYINDNNNKYINR